VAVDHAVEENPRNVQQQIYTCLRKWKGERENLHYAQAHVAGRPPLPTVETLLEAMRRSRDVNISWESVQNIVEDLL